MSDSCDVCKDREYLRKLFTPHNNPNNYKPKHYRDGSPSFTMGDLRKKLVNAARSGATSEELCDLLDKEFLFGAWAHVLEHQQPDLIRDLRGLIIGLLPNNKARKRQDDR